VYSVGAPSLLLTLIYRVFNDLGLIYMQGVVELNEIIAKRQCQEFPQTNAVNACGLVFVISYKV